MSRLRICVIGNSHLASLKMAWGEMANRYPDVELTFFGSHGGTLRQLRRSGRTLVPGNEAMRENFRWISGGRDAIAVDDYDVIVLHGLVSFHAILKEVAAEGLLDAPANGDWREAVAGCQALSLDDFLPRMTGGVVGALLAPLRKPVLFSPQSLPSEAILGDTDKHAAPWRAAVDDAGQPTPATAALLALWQEFLDRPDVVPQPAETRANGLFTAASWSEGSQRLTQNRVEHGKEDRMHMNAAYGGLVLEAVLKRSENLPKAEPVAAAAGDDQPRRQHPYKDLPQESFWNRAVTGREAEEISGWYRRKFPLRDMRIASAGSCFAQHIGRRLRGSGFSYVDVEPAPAGMLPAQQKEDGYGMYSARFGNVYTSRQLLQLFDRAFGEFQPQESAWETADGFVDPFRPTIQARPFGSVEEVVAARDQHLAAVRRMFEDADVFVFTLGLTETWQSVADGAVYPVAPGVSGGSWDPVKYQFVNLDSGAVSQDLRQFMNKARSVKKGMKFLFTVSPVPLMATASKSHVVVATTYSKSVLRAVAGELAGRLPYVDYFPSFEIINSHVMEGRYYGEDKRSVEEAGVDHVMRQFFAVHRSPRPAKAQAQAPADDENDVFCDEALLAAFGNPGTSGK